MARKSAARKFHIFVLLFTYALFLSSGFAENMAQWRVPEGGKVPFDSTPINALTFSADGSRLAVASADGIALYDTYTGEVLRLFPVLMDDLTALALSSDGRMVAGTGEDAIVRLWDAHTGEHRTDLIGHADPVVTLAFSPDGNILASGSFKEIRLWDLTFGEAQRAVVLQGHRDMVTTLAFSPDSKTLASTSFYGTILLWDVEAGQLRHSLPAHTDSILTLAFSPDINSVYGKTLASAGWDNTIRIWDPRNGQLQAVVEGDTSPIVALAYLSDMHGNYGKTLASAGLDGTIQLRSLEDGQIPNQQRNARVAFRADVNSDGVVNILDLTFIASRFGESSPDLNSDGVVNILDLILVAQYLRQ